MHPGRKTPATNLPTAWPTPWPSRTDDAYGRPDIYELNGKIASRVLPELAIDWDCALRDLD